MARSLRKNQLGVPGTPGEEVQKRRLGQRGVCSLVRELGFILNIMEL